MSDTIKTLIQKSKNNDVNAQYELGMQYYNGTDIAQDYEKAAEQFKLAAEKKHTEAQFQYGIMLKYGLGIEKNEQKAVKLFKLLAKKGNVRAQIEYGWMLENGCGIEINKQEAVVQYKLASEQGDAQAQFCYGLMLINDLGTEINLQAEKALMYLEKDGDPFELFSYGLKCSGHATKKNLQEAFKQFKLAAEQGHPKAKINYGWMLANGVGTEKNEQEAFEQFKLAKIEKEAEERYGSWAFYNYNWMLNFASNDLIKRAAEQGDAAAQSHYAQRLQTGDGIEKDEQEAFKYYKLAAEQGDENGERQYKHMLKKGFGNQDTNNSLNINVETNTPVASTLESSPIKVEETKTPQSTEENSSSTLNSHETEFERHKKVVKDSFIAKLNSLHTTLIKQTSDKNHHAEAGALHQEINTALDTFFKKLTLNTDADEIQENFKIFQITCSTYASKADAVMGHGWLFRAIEVLGKAIGALFVGMGMAVGSIFLQGFAKESHRNWYHDSFFTPHQTESSKTIKSLDQDINDLEQEVKKLTK